MNKVLVINHKSMYNMGGIQKISYQLTKYMLLQGIRVVWLHEFGSEIAEAFRDILKMEGFSIVNVSNNRIKWFDYGQLPISVDDEVVVLSFTTINMIKADDIVRRYKGYHIKSIYAVANTTGSEYYYETYFNGLFKRIAKQCMNYVVDFWNSNGQLTFCSLKQIEPFENTYGIRVCNWQSKLFKGIWLPPALDEQLLLDRVKRESFNIITVGRFCFPHKGYMLGLVRAFGRLKVKYRKLTLAIIGCGPDERLLLDEIDKQPIDIKKDITLLGAVPNNQLHKYFEKCHLNISVAAAVGDGAKCGVVSIPARNHCTGECEVYGYLPQSRPMAVATSEGELVDKYIVDLIEMDEVSYKAKCIESYKTYSNPDNYDPWWVFKVAEKSITQKIPIRYKICFKILDYLKKIQILKNRRR